MFEKKTKTEVFAVRGIDKSLIIRNTQAFHLLLLLSGQLALGKQEGNRKLQWTRTKSFYKPATYTWSQSCYSLERQELALLTFLFLLVNSLLCRKGTRQTFSIQWSQMKAQPQVLLCLRRDLPRVRNHCVSAKTLPQMNVNVHPLLALSWAWGPS